MKTSKITLLRLLCSGAIVGIAVGNMLGIDLSAHIPTDMVTGFAGAGAAAIALKLVHIL